MGNYLRQNYPHVHLIWKLPYANHMHKANPNVCFSRWTDGGSCVTALRYATLERFHYLYQAQKKLLTNQHSSFGGDPMISVLDLYELSYTSGASHMIPNDSLHYQPQWNAEILQLLYQ